MRAHGVWSAATLMAALVVVQSTPASAQNGYLALEPPAANYHHDQFASATASSGYGTQPWCEPGFGRAAPMGKWFCHNPLNDWSFQSETLFLKRNKPREIVLAGLDPGTPGAPQDDFPLMTTHDLTSDFESGFRVNAGKRIDDDMTLELSYMRVHGFDGRETVAGPGNIDVPFQFQQFDQVAGTIDFQGAHAVSARYHSNLDSVELNVRRLLLPSTSVLAGFRYVRVREGFALFANDLDVGNDLQPSPYTIDTWNDLFGAQIGANQRILLTERLSLDFDALAGLFYNSSRQETLWRDEGVLLRNFSTSGDSAAFVGELRLSGVYNLTENLSFRAGYQLMWIEGLALAPEQIDYTLTPASGSRIRTNGDIFYHGVSLGLEFVR
jgi:hypothetical protein